MHVTTMPMLLSVQVIVYLIRNITLIHTYHLTFVPLILLGPVNLYLIPYPNALGGVGEGAHKGLAGGVRRLDECGAGTGRLAGGGRGAGRLAGGGSGTTGLALQEGARTHV